VLAVYLFAAFWVVLALGLFFVGVRGGLGGARATLQTQTRGGRKTLTFVFVFVYVVFGVAIPALILTGNHANANAQVGGIRLTSAEKQGRTLFGQHCGVCHTLSATNSVGKVGPDLDTLRPPASLVANTIANGCLQNPPSNSNQTCLGYGTMPANVLAGKQAEDVAQFVAAVAGQE
jgi:cytochrome c551